MTLQGADIDDKCYTTHSFRIGAATSAMDAGISNAYQNARQLEEQCIPALCSNPPATASKTSKTVGFSIVGEPILLIHDE